MVSVLGLEPSQLALIVSALPMRYTNTMGEYSHPKDKGKIKRKNYAQLVTPAGFEPSDSGLKGRRLEPT